MREQGNEGWALALARQLCHVTWSNLPQQPRQAAMQKLVHAMGVSLAHGDLPASRTAWIAFGASRGESIGFGQRRRVATEDAAFINGTIGHGSLLEDCGPGGLRGGSHPGTFIIPAALALAEEIDADGPALLEAIVAGYETMHRLGAAAPAEIVQRRFRPLGIMGTLGAAAASARLLDATPEQMAAALAIAATLAGGTTQGIFEGTMDAYFEAAFAARNGIAAARLGLAGASTPVEALEGEFGFFQTYGGVQGNLEAITARQDSYGIEHVGVKRFAACLQNQQTISLLVQGLASSLALSDVTKVIIKRSATGTNGLNSPGVSRRDPFPNMLAAQMAARFTAAAAILGHEVDNPDFFASHFDDPEITALTKRIELVPTTDSGVRIEITLRDGSELVLDGTNADLLHPSLDEVIARFDARTSRVLGEPAAVEIRDAILSLADGRKVRDVTRCLELSPVGERAV
ncbi:MmgE/PrpD family protein [Chelatococcus asaccharovorans]|uniref:MmgE/PrpD family protein n=1 Tax=Chelatococcus asaccharovorans TaxID=28210 RepID=UPI00224C70BB|nr:MmgE/PrpD family protein [Chelatococcus asaccharovorans]CAH1655868.1 2-methylcitrate dehydratase PrpD [Chelatococcus asaccharovorans]CAH1685281.1 2-methylcitrate dehydratase PrpD [Chelatococcus asaccharovorans]